MYRKFEDKLDIVIINSINTNNYELLYDNFLKEDNLFVYFKILLLNIVKYESINNEISNKLYNVLNNILTNAKYNKHFNKKYKSTSSRYNINDILTWLCPKITHKLYNNITTLFYSKTKHHIYISDPFNKNDKNNTFTGKDEKDNKITLSNENGFESLLNNGNLSQDILLYRYHLIINKIQNDNNLFSQILNTQLSKCDLFNFGRIPHHILMFCLFINPNLTMDIIMKRLINFKEIYIINILTSIKTYFSIIKEIKNDEKIPFKFDNYLDIFFENYKYEGNTLKEYENIMFHFYTNEIKLSIDKINIIPDNNDKKLNEINRLKKLYKTLSICSENKLFNKKIKTIMEKLLTNKTIIHVNIETKWSLINKLYKYNKSNMIKNVDNLKQFLSNNIENMNKNIFNIIFNIIKNIDFKYKQNSSKN